VSRRRGGFRPQLTGRQSCRCLQDEPRAAEQEGRLRLVMELTRIKIISPGSKWGPLF